MKTLDDKTDTKGDTDIWADPLYVIEIAAYSPVHDSWISVARGTAIDDGDASCVAFELVIAELSACPDDSLEPMIGDLMPGDTLRQPYHASQPKAQKNFRLRGRQPFVIVTRIH